MSILIKNGRIITASDDYQADIYVENETISAIGKNLNVKTIRRLIVNISNNSAFTEYHTSRKLHRPSGTWMSEYLLVLELEKGYEIKK